MIRLSREGECMAFKLKTHFVNSIPIVSINGDLTSQEIPPVCAELVKYIKTSAKGIAVDLSGTDFMDSQGLGIIIYCSQMYKKASKQFFIIKPRDFLRTIMKDLSCDQIFKIVDSEEQVLI
jgi:anti-anti-sigma factor